MHTVDDVQLLKRCLTMAGYSIEGLGGVSDEWSHEDVMRGARKILRDYLEGWRRIAELEAEKFHGSSWADIENYGYRCVRVTVREELGR